MGWGRASALGGSDLGLASAKWFWLSQLVVRRGDQGDKQVCHERLPRGGTTLVRALSDGAEKGEHGVSDTAQDGDDEGCTRAGRRAYQSSVLGMLKLFPSSEMTPKGKSLGSRAFLRWALRTKE